MARFVTASVSLMLASVAGGAAVAQEQASVTLTGFAEQGCVVGLPVQGGTPPVNVDSLSGQVFSVTQLTDPVTLTTRAASVTLTMDAMCNSIHRVIIASDNNGLWRQNAGVAPSGFGSAVPYEANLVWADQQHLMTADGGTRRYVEDVMLVGRAAAGDMLIEFAIDAGSTNAGINAPLLAGTYSDVLRITVQPQ